MRSSRPSGVPEKRPNERALCLIITDGEENASRETTLGQVKAVIREREARGDWTFAYLGATPDRWTRDTGMSSASAVAFRIAEPQASFRLASDATRRLRVSRRQSTRSFFAPAEPSDADTERRDGVKARWTFERSTRSPRA
jgi:hypothetical protein